MAYKNKLLPLFLFGFLGCIPIHAQTRVLLGVDGGQNYGNTSVGVNAGIEVPFAKRLEVGFLGKYSPFERHVPFGQGTAYNVKGSGTAWLTPSFGATGSINYGGYSVDIKKNSTYVSGGLVVRHSWGGVPSRLKFQYVRQINNHMVGGTESSYLQGAEFAMTSRLYCKGKACYRFGWSFDGGRVLTQSNPVCDGSFGGPVTCPRGVSASGGFNILFQVELPRRMSTEVDAF